MIRTLLFLVLLAPLSALAADITPDTACGAPGVGYRGVVSSGIPLRIVEQAVPGQRVNAKGHWEPCRQPPACPDRSMVERDGSRWMWQSENGRATCTAGLSSIRHGKLGDKRTVIDRRWQGLVIWRCTPDGWRIDVAYCR